MNLVIAPGDAVVDQFPAFEDDGYSKRTGLLLGDFTISTFHDGAVEALTVAIAEIGTTGEYKAIYTPPTNGIWHVQVLIDFNKDIWASWAFADSTGGVVGDQVVVVKSQVDKIDLIPTLGPNAVTSGSLMDRMMNKNVFKTFNQETDSMEAIRDRTG